MRKTKALIILICLMAMTGVSFALPTLEFIKSDISITSACSYYSINYTGTKTQLINNLTTFKVNSVKEVYGNLKALTMEIQAYNSSLGYYWVPAASYNFGTGTDYKAPTKTSIDANLSNNYDAINDKVAADKKIVIRICGQYKPNIQGNITRISIDHLPEVLGVVYTKYAWWNSTFIKRVPININTSVSMSDYQVAYFNLTYQTGMKSDFSDIRFTAPDNATELSYYISRYVASTWAEVNFKTNISTNNGTQAVLYFNNSAATTNSSFDNTFTKAMNYTTSLNVQYHLDDNNLGVCTDTSGNGNTGTANGYSWIAQDGGYWGNFTGVRFATGYNFYSTTGYILPNKVWHNDDTEAWTLEMWIATNETGSDNTTAKLKVPLIGWSDANVYAAWGIDSSHLCYKHYSAGWLISCGTTNISNGTWHHVAYVNYVNGSGTLFVDGNIETSFSASIDAGHYFEFREIGRGYPPATPSYYNGNFDEIRAYNRSLTIDEIRTNRERRKYLGGTYSIGLSATENFTYEEPQAILVSPSNGSTGNTLTPNLAVKPMSNNSATINVSFYNASNNALICANASVSNNTNVYCNWTTATTSLYNYSWYVNLSDGYAKNRSYTWSFITADFIPPTIVVNSPPNGFTNISMSAPQINITASDNSSQYLNISFYNASDNSKICNYTNGTANMSFNCNWNITPTIGYIVHTWYANVSDGTFTATTGNYTFNLSAPGVNVSTYLNGVGNYTNASATQISFFNATHQINYTGNNVSVNCTALPGGNITIQATYLTQTKQSLFNNDCTNYTNVEFIFTGNATAFYFYIYDIYNVPISGARLDFYELTGGSYALTTTAYSQVDGYVYEIYLGVNLPVQVITTKTGYVSRNDTFTPYVSTLLPIRIRLDEVVFNGSGQYDPLQNLSITCTPGDMIQNNNTLITCVVVEADSKLLTTIQRVYLVNYSGAYSMKNTTCVNPATCSFTYTLNYTGSRFRFNTTINTSYGNYTYTRDYFTNGTAFYDLPSNTDLSKGTWKFIFFVIILIVLAITYGYLGALALLIIPVMVGFGVLYGVFSLGELILLLLLVFIIFMKMV